MDLSDAAMRERAVRECPEGPPHTRCPRCDWQAEQYIALRDAARAEQRETPLPTALTPHPYHECLECGGFGIVGMLKIADVLCAKCRTAFQEAKEQWDYWRRYE